MWKRENVKMWKCENSGVYKPEPIYPRIFDISTITWFIFFYVSFWKLRWKRCLAESDLPSCQPVYLYKILESVCQEVGASAY